jgi:hypothetical protein
MPKIYRYIEEILSGFVKAFKTNKLLKTFIFISVCMMIRADFDGMASLVRVFAAPPSVCGIVQGFFKSGGWLLSNLIFEWTKMFKGREEVCGIDGMPALIGVRANVEMSGEKMPGVKGISVVGRSKNEKVKGRMFGAVGIAHGVKEKLFRAPLSTRLREGFHGIAAWTGGAASARPKRAPQ